MAYLIKTFSQPDGRVLDGFMGTGSTGLAAILEGRKFDGFELNRHYVDIAQRRFAEMMENPASLVALDKKPMAMGRRQEQAPLSEFISRHIG